MWIGWGAPTLGSIVERLARERPEDLFLIDPDGGRTSYGRFVDLALDIGARLRTQGVGPGDRVVTLCRNQLGFLGLAFGAWSLGAGLVPVNHEQRGRSLASILENAAPDLVVADDAGIEALAGVGSELSSAAKTVRLDDFLKTPVASRPRSIDPGTPEAMALTLYSSGTTGVSKGCMLSHEYLVWCGEDFARAADLVATDAVYSPGPLYHINAWWSFTGAMVAGIRYAFDVRFSVSRFWSRMEEADATIFDYAGVMISMLLRRGGVPGPRSRARAGIGGAARPDEAKAFTEKFGVPLLECYGLTECCLPIFQRESELRLGSIGRLSEHFEARLVDDRGADVPPGQAGELWLKPHSRRVIFSGYLQRSDLTRAAFADGWFRTGDICRLDADGYYYYLDRKRNFIRRRGENISPFEVEGVILDHPQVANCAVIGVPSELGEEDVLLAVEPREGAVIDPSELRRWCAERMAAFMVPRYVRVMKLPLTPSERVEKGKLREEGVAAGTFDAERAAP